MAQVIYTGQGLQAPQTRGYAMQALSQFGQQEQARKTYEIERAYKDRDAFAKMLELDPVYASSKAAQDMIAGIMDDYIDEMTILEKNRKGPKTTKDLMRMQQARGRAMAQMNYIKGANEQITQAAKIMASPQGANYDRELFQKGFEQWTKEGTLPEEGLLFPAIRNPLPLALMELNQLDVKWDEKEDFLQGDTFLRKAGYTLKGRAPSEWADQVMNNPNMQYNALGSFDRDKTIPEEKKQQYINMAGGNEAAAATMYYRDQLVDILSKRVEEEFDKRPYRYPDDPATKKEKQVYIRGNTRVIDNKDAYTRQRVFGSMIAKSGADGVRFEDAVRNEAYSVPIKFLDLSINKNELGLPEGARINVSPEIAADNQIEFRINPRENTQITITVDDYGKLPKSQQGKYERVDKADGTSEYRYKDRLPENISAVGNLFRVGTFLPSLFLEDYSNWYPQKGTTKTLTGTSAWQVPMKPKEQAEERPSYLGPQVITKSKGQASKPKQSTTYDWSQHKRNR